MLRLFLPKTIVQVAALFWGVAGYLPVGMTYLAAFLLIFALCINGIGFRVKFLIRCRRVYQHAVFWPLCFFLVWTLLIWVFQPHFAETPSNLFHSLRIVVTIMLVVMLDADELRAALLGWVVGTAVVLAIIYINLAIPLPHITGLRDILSMHNNKSIGICILLAIFATSSLIYCLKNPVDKYQRFAMLGLLLVLPVLIWFLPSRTSLLLVFCTLLIGLSHFYWQKPVWLVSALVIVFILGFGLTQTPQVQKRFAQGLNELQASQMIEHASSPDLDTASWRVRYLFYTHTSQMIAEKPVLGWGVGSWNDQWRQRTPSHLRALNMPHNDFLWVGSQAGIPAMLALLTIVLSLALNVIQQRGIAATCSLVATSGLLVAMSFNSALRDAQIGMSLLFVVTVMNAWALAQAKSAHLSA